MTAALAGPYLASAGLLGVAGLGKVARPIETAGALRAANLPGTKGLVRAGAAAEVAIAIAAYIARGPAPAVLVASSYLAFAVFVGLALRRGWPIASCGCFGRPDTVPTATHLVLNAGAVVVAVGWALTGTDTVAAAFAHQPWAGAPLALATAVTCGLAYLMFTNPLDQRRNGRSTDEPH